METDFAFHVAGRKFSSLFLLSPTVQAEVEILVGVIIVVLALCVLPILFVYFAVTSELNLIFLLFLVGQSMTVYSLIIPTETRDYYVDKAMNVVTLTVRLGLVRASLLGSCCLVLEAFSREQHSSWRWLP